MGLLDGGIASAFAAVFGGVYLDGTLYRKLTGDDGLGGGSGNGFDDGTAVKVQVDAATQAMRTAEGFVDSDVRILMLAHGIATPDTDAEIVAGVRYSIQSVATDPAGSYYEMRGRCA